MGDVKDNTTEDTKPQVETPAAAQAVTDSQPAEAAASTTAEQVKAPEAPVHIQSFQRRNLLG